MSMLNPPQGSLSAHSTKMPGGILNKQEKQQRLLSIEDREKVKEKERRYERLPLICQMQSI